MKLRRKSKQMFIPLSSTSDIAFLLLIFIMLVSLINYRRSVDIQYAFAESAGSVVADNNFEIWVDISGNYFLDGIPIAAFLLDESISEAVAGNPFARVHLIADRNTPFENVQLVLSVLQRLNHREVSFVVRNE